MDSKPPSLQHHPRGIEVRTYSYKECAELKWLLASPTCNTALEDERLESEAIRSMWNFTGLFPPSLIALEDQGLELEAAKSMLHTSLDFWPTTLQEAKLSALSGIISEVQ
jgi:hypothetical protein